MQKTALHRLPLKEAYNVRDLGGYPGKDDGVTAYRQFLRADDVSVLPEEDMDYLIRYGLRTVIDLRTSQEIAQDPHVFAKRPEVDYLHISLLPKDTGEETSLEEMLQWYPGDQVNVLTDMYLDILKNGKQALRQVFEKMAEQEGTVLFHCTAGKDRTGVVAMLLLGLAGVGRADIIANYMVTEIYNATNPKAQVFNLPFELPKSLSESKPEFIARAYDDLIDQYGFFRAYFESLGLAEASINQIERKLLTL